MFKKFYSHNNGRYDSEKREKKKEVLAVVLDFKTNSTTLSDYAVFTRMISTPFSGSKQSNLPFTHLISKDFQKLEDVGSPII